MAEKFVATRELFVGNARAANPGDLIDGDTVKNNGWEDGVARLGTKAAEEAVYDPSEHTVDEVNAHLAEVDDAERDRILAAEAAGRNRTGITGG